MLWLKEIVVLWVLIFEVAIISVNGFNRYQMKVCMKEDAGSSAKPVIDSKTTDFKEFVAHSNIFVDKSVLIKSILEEQPLVSLTFPSKWGKSINLDMLKSFLEIEFDHTGEPVEVNGTWSYQYFRQGVVRNKEGRCEKLMNPPLIANHEDIVNQHLSKYPVILIDLSATSTESNFTEYFDAFRSTVASIFKKYDFMVELIRDKLDNALTSGTEKAKKKTQLQKFKSFQRRENNDYKEMMNSLEFLSGLLREHFHQRVVMLIDNYDTPIQLGYIEKASRVGSEEAQKFMNFFIDFLSNTFASGENIVRGVLTGVLSLDIHSIPLLGLNQIVNYNAVSKNMYPFYGFTAIDAGQLLARKFNPEHVKTILEKYEGYHASNYPDITFYNPGAIVDVVQEGKIDDHWFHHIGTKASQILPHVLRHEDVLNMFRILISGGVDAEMKRRNFTLNREDILSLNKVITGDKDISLTPKGVASILVFHFATGYLTLDFSNVHPNWNKRVHFKIPCVDTERTIVEELIKHYEGALGGDIATNARLAANSLTYFVDTDIVTSVRGMFLKFYQAIFDHKSFKDSKQNLLDSGHFLILLYARLGSNFQYNVGLNTTYYDNSQKKQAPYITMYGKSNGLICSFNYSKTSETESSADAPQTKEWYKLKQFEGFFKGKSVKNIRVLVLHYAYESRKLSVVRNGEEGVW